MDNKPRTNHPRSNHKPQILESEHALRILKEIETNPRVTQRYLSRKFDISLGKINFLINALMHKGLIEAKNFKNSKNKLAYKYLLTPQGIKIKLNLTRKFLIWKMQEFEKIKHEIKAYRDEIRKRPANSLEAEVGNSALIYTSQE